MYPELEAAFAAIDAAQAAYDKARAEAPRCNLALSPSECPGCKATQPAQAALDAARKGPWEAAKKSADPLVRWIAKNCEEYRAEALLVLKALPAPMAELDALAKDKGWCDQWDAFKRFAEQDGVLPAETGAEVSA